MITVSWNFIIICFAVFFITEVAKICVRKYIGDKWVGYIPLILLILLTAIYTLITKNLLNGIINGVAVTAFAVYFYQLVKPLLEKIKKLKKK